MDNEKYIVVKTGYGTIRKYLIIDGEEWRPVVGFEELYEVSNFGRVRSKQDKWASHEIRLLKEVIRASGYYAVSLSKDGREYRKQVHRLQADAFIPNPENKPYVNHKNGIKSDNSLSNLEWVTASENVQHAYDTGLHRKPKGSSNHFSILNESQAIEICNSNLPNAELAKMYNVCTAAISKIKTGKNWADFTNKQHVPHYFLTDAKVLEIFHSELSAKELAIKYNTSESNIYIIRNGKNWSHVTGKQHNPKFRKPKRSI